MYLMIFLVTGTTPWRACDARGQGDRSDRSDRRHQGSRCSCQGWGRSTQGEFLSQSLGVNVIHKHPIQNEHWWLERIYMDLTDYWLMSRSVRKIAATSCRDGARCAYPVIKIGLGRTIEFCSRPILQLSFDTQNFHCRRKPPATVDKR